MTSAFKFAMKARLNSALKPLLLASMMAGAGLPALAQSPPIGAPGGPSASVGGQSGMMRHGPMDPAKIQAMVLKHQAALKEKLKITSAQESAWTAFTGTMKPPADMGRRRMDMRAEMEKLSTPERIDKMRALRVQRNAEMDKRADATKAFYAVLSPEQQKVFDAHPMRGHHERRHGHR